MAVFPNSVRSFVSKIDLVDTVFALHINDLQDEMVAVQTELGPLAKGTYTSVKARLDAVDSGKAPVSHDHANRLDITAHDVTARHQFGSAFGTPGNPSTQTFGDTAVVGGGPAPAAEQHKHAWPTVAQAQNALIPAGVIWEYAGNNPPTGWLFCDGSLQLQATYPALYTAIGTNYNTGGENLGTQFRLPNLVGKMPMGKASPAAAVVSGGSRDAVLPSHAHPGSGVSNGTADHQHYVDHQHSQSDSGGHVHSNTPPDYGDRMCITSGGTQNDWLVNINASNRGVGITFSHIYTGDGNHNHGWVSAMIGRQYTDYATNSGANHGHGLTVAAQGVSATDANLPPYQTVNYIVKAH